MARPKSPWWSYVLAIALSIVPAFFIVFNSVFSDIFSTSDRLLSVLLIVFVYEVFGFIFGYIWPATGWQWGFWISFTAVALVVLYSISEGQYLLHLVYILFTVVSACQGAFWGKKLKLKRTA